MTENRPNALYKYRTVNENGLRIISHNEVFYASPSMFNDPYELEFNVSIKQKPNSTANRVAIESLRPKIEANIKGAFHKTIGFLSLSALNNQILMWSHYSNKHTGFCVGINPSALTFENLKPITYSKHLYSVKCQLDEKEEGVKVPIENDQYLIGICNTKYDCWKYEEEWRDVKRVSGIATLPQDAVQEVVLGLKTSDTDNALIIDALILRRQNFPSASPVKLMQAQASTDKYELEIIDTGRTY